MSERRQLLVIAAGTCALLMPYCALAKDSVPQWVRDAAAEKLPDYPAETDAVKLLDEHRLSVQGPDKTVEHCRLVIRILRPQGREFANMHVYFDKESKIDSLKIWSISADGREFQLPEAQISNRGFGEGNLYSDLQVREGKATANDPGAVVAMEYDRKVRPYMSEDIWEYQSELPVHKAVYTLELAPLFEFRTTWFHHAELQPADLGGNRWQWTMTDVPAVDVRHVTLHPAPVSLYERMSVHYFGPGMTTPFRGNWASIGEWYTRLSEGRMQASPEITAKAEALTAGKMDFYPKAAAIADFMQRDIRYFGVEIGIGGWQPHAAAEVFRYHYGDCKDKATLLLSMLGTVGIQGKLVMVHHERGAIDPLAPSDFGDHMIAAIQVPPDTDTAHLYSLVKSKDGRQFVIFDPTQPWIPFGQIPSYEQGSYGLLIDGANSQILALPVDAPERSTLSRTATFKLSPDGTLQGDVVEAGFGNSAWQRRSRFTEDDNKRRDDWLDHHVRQDLSNFTVADFHIDNLANLNKDLEVHYHVTAPQYSKTMGALLLLRPRVLGKDSPEIDHEAKRALAVDLDQTRIEHDDYTIELPPGYAVDELPDPVKFDLGFAAYESTISVQANVLHYTRTLTVRDVELPARKYADLTKMAGMIHGDEEGRAVLKRLP